jgi:hypothetical protein
MSFRRDTPKQLAFQRWCQANATLLLRSHIPARVYQDENTWRYFIEHGHTPDANYATIHDVDLIADISRQESLRDAILSFAGATESNVFYTLPPYLFGALWDDLDGRLALRKVARPAK